MSEVHLSAQRGKTIFLVDDEPCLLKLLKEVLEKNGYSVISADTPAKALQFAELHKEHIDLLLTDVVMPEMDGCELSRRVRTIIPDLKVLFISGFTAGVIGENAQGKGCVAFLRKPFSIKALYSTIVTLLYPLAGL